MANDTTFPKPSLSAESRRIPRSEAAILLALILFGFVLRVWQIGNVDLDHFDEGVYAFSALGLSDPDQPHRIFPDQIKFSPPVYFGLVGLASYLSREPVATTTLIINVLIGTLTIPLIWWVGRTWFGNVAGIIAAVFVTFSEFHIALSRTALTDVAFAFFFLLALYVITIAFQHQSIGLAFLAGIAIGVAWNTKYHGWFALVAAAGALVPMTIDDLRKGRSPMRYFSLWAIMAIIAIACYLPWALFIQSQPGGYVALAQYQRTLLSTRWLHNLWQQAQQQVLFEGAFSRASVLLAPLVAWLLSNVQLLPRRRFWLLVVLLSISALLVGEAGTCVLLSVLSLLVLLKTPVRFQDWLLLSWMGLWIVSTPVYHPYARLVLPFSIATYLAAGLALAALSGRIVMTMTDDSSQPAIVWRPLATAAAALAIFAVSATQLDLSDPWQQTNSVVEAVKAMETAIPTGERVLVIGEPTVAFYLHLADRPAFEYTERIEQLDDIHQPVHIVTGVYAKRAPSLRNGLAKLENRLELIGAYEMTPDLVRVLDDANPFKAIAYLSKPDDTYELTLYRLHPIAQ